MCHTADYRFLVHAEPPEAPLITNDNITCLGANNNLAQFLVQWTEPNNIGDFDLDHYELETTAYVSS